MPEELFLPRQNSKERVKYLDHNLSWFEFLDTVKHLSDDVAISKRIVESLLLSTQETNKSLRIRKLVKLK
jgi:hypothetical protein